jgi:ABC-2 type transport system permease protein
VKGTLVIYRRELAGLFRAPIGWLLLLLALAANGFLFYAYMSGSRGNVTASLEGALGGGPTFWAFIVLLPPLLAMRMLSEESGNGTLEYLLTAPITDAAVVVGKHLAATTFMAILWSSVLIYAAAIHMAGAAPDWAALLCTYVGAVLVSGLFLSIGLLASCLSSTPLLAAFLAFLACVTWLMIPQLVNLIMGQVRVWFESSAGGLVAAENWIRGALDKMDVLRHFQTSFRLGVLDSAELVFFLTWPAFFLFLTVRALEARRWRG